MASLILVIDKKNRIVEAHPYQEVDLSLIGQLSDSPLDELRESHPDCSVVEIREVLLLPPLNSK